MTFLLFHLRLISIRVFLVINRKYISVGFKLITIDVYRENNFCFASNCFYLDRRRRRR
jgi:hypothetical protein